MIAGAARGLMTWMIYGLVEFAMASLSVMVMRRASMFADWSWRYTGIVFGGFAVAGFALGALSWRWTRGRERLAERINLALLVTAYVANLAVGMPLPAAGSIALGVAVAVLALLVWGKPEGLANPWIVAAVLTAPPVINSEVLNGRPVWFQAGISVVLLAVAVGSALVPGLWRWVWPGAVWRQAALTAAVAAGVFGATAALNRAPTAPVTHGAKGQGKPNVLLVVMDTARADHLSVYGYERDTTPNLEEFAREASVYRRAIASADMTLPSHASIFTGLYASAHGAHLGAGHLTNLGLGGQPLPENALTVAEILSSQGYFTAGIAANRSYMQPEFGFAQGFQIFDSRSPVMVFNYSRQYLLRLGVRRVLNLFVDTSRLDLRTREANEVSGDALRLLERVKAEKEAPFFLFLNYMDAHVPYVPPPPFDRKFPGKDRHFDYERYRALQPVVLQGKRTLTAAEQAHLESQYDGGIAFLDSQLGVLFGKLKEMGLYENTLIVVTSDHGEAFGDRHLIEHAVSVYEDQVWVPLMVKYPGQKQGEVVEAMASHVDIVPTVLDTAGLPAPPGLHGRSLRKLAEGGPREVFAESFAAPPLFHAMSAKRLTRVERAIYSGSLKFITSTKGKRELYDLAHDPQERKNLFRADDKISLALQATLNEWIKKTEAQAKVAAKVDKKSLERLKSLGYVQ